MSVASGQINERVIVLEHGVESLEKRICDRLDDNAVRVASLAEKMEDIDRRLAPKPADKWKVAGFVVGIALAMLTWVWQAARYPDRSEYTALATKVEEATSDIRSRLQQMRESQLTGAAEVRLLQHRVESLRAEVEGLGAGRARQQTSRR